jgi:putative ATP-dependent endonuclease of the OLD family
MYSPNSPFISRVKIKNFRNYNEIDVNLNHKQIIIGENNVGKTNFLRAIQLILDPQLSDEDRFLLESDFYEGLNNPMESGEKIEILIEIQGYEHNKTILSTLCDATISTSPKTLRFTYEYYPTKKVNGKNQYMYRIYQGNDVGNPFTSFHRRFLNIKVIQAIRDVESEMRNRRRSPISHLIKQYEIDKEELHFIGKELKEKSDVVLSIDELLDLTKNINKRYSDIIGTQVDAAVSLETIDVDPDRLLNTLKLMIGSNTKRPISDTSLGLNNILYISLILLSLEDKTVPSILKPERYDELLQEDGHEILLECYKKNTKKTKYILKKNLNDNRRKNLYEFMDNHSSDMGVTILAIEEPESHLHPALQRIIFKDVMKQKTSLLMTTHSPFITSVAPIDAIVHMRYSTNGTEVNTTASLKLEDRNQKDLERFIDVKRGEIYFGKGVILVEGDAEEYLIPSFADRLGMPLDNKGIICCNISSTNFKPYVQFLDALGIPYVVVTDGDYYYIKKEKSKEKKFFGEMHDDAHKKFGYDGNDRVAKILTEINKVKSSKIPEDYSLQDILFSKYGFFIGQYTMEIDIFNTTTKEKGKEIIFQLFNDLTLGKKKQKENFKKAFNAGDFVSCLAKIENSNSGIGKGRFAQQFSIECKKSHIPDYIKKAIKTIYEKVDDI